MRHLGIDTKELELLSFTPDEIENLDFLTISRVIDYRMASFCYELIKKYEGMDVPIHTIKTIINKYGSGWEHLKDKEVEVLEECENNEETPFNGVYSYDIDSLDGFIPGFSYHYVDDKTMYIDSMYIDS